LASLPDAWFHHLMQNLDLIGGSFIVVHAVPVCVVVVIGLLTVMVFHGLNIVFVGGDFFALCFCCDVSVVDALVAWHIAVDASSVISSSSSLAFWLGSVIISGDFAWGAVMDGFVSA